MEEIGTKTSEVTLEAPVAEALAAAGLEVGKPLAVMASQLSLDGDFQRNWLVVLEDKLVVAHETAEGKIEPRLQYDLAELEAVRRLDYFGSTVLEAKKGDQFVPLLRAAPRQAATWMRALAQLNKRIKELRGEDTSGIHLPPAHKSRDVCEVCGQPIIPRIGVCLNCLNRRKVFFRLLSLSKRYWVLITFGMILMGLLVAADLAQPYLQKRMIDDVILPKNLDLLKLIVWIILGLTLFSALFSGVRSYLMDYLGEHVSYDLRRQLYEHLQRLSLSFYDRKQTGWIMDRISNDAPNLRDFLTDQLIQIIRNTLQLILIGVIMFLMNWRLALLSLLPAPIIVFGAAWFMKRVRPAFLRWWTRRSSLNALLGDVIPGVRMVKAFAQEKREAQRFDERSGKYMWAGIFVARLFASFFPAITLTTSIGSLVIWGYGGYLLVTGSPGLTLGDLVAFMGYLWRFYGPLQEMSFLSHRLQRAATAAQRIFEVLDTEPDIVEKPEAKDVELTGRVTFDHVTFGYDPSVPVIKDLTFEVEPSEMIGLVGPSGAGKSTTMALLARFYDVDEGSIRLDGVDIRDLKLKSLRNQLALVPQEPILFHATIAENIAYGRPEASLTDIIKAAKAANAHDFIVKLPEGYDTLVGERGSRLSGGERQRISIARAILKDPKILILDEATSSVDSETEELIREAIERLIKHRTTFAIAHRLSTLRSADRLLVLEEGRLVELGTHAELLAKEDGTFKRLVEIQSQLSQIVAVGG